MNNNSAKVRQSPEVNDDDDVETVTTAETEPEGLMPQKLMEEPTESNNNPEGLTETEQVS